MKLFSRYFSHSLVLSSFLPLSILLVSDTTFADERPDNKLIAVKDITKPFEKYKDDSNALFSFLAGYRDGNQIRYNAEPYRLGSRNYPDGVDIEIYWQGYNLAIDDSHNSISGIGNRLSESEKRAREDCEERIRRLAEIQDKKINKLLGELKGERGKSTSAQNYAAVLESKLKYCNNEVSAAKKKLDKFKD